MKWCLGTRSPVASRCPDEPSFVSLAVKPVGKPDALIGHVRFDERGWETGRRLGVSARAHPRLYKSAAGRAGGIHFDGNAVFRPQHTLVLLIVPKTKSLIRFGREMRALHWRAVTRLDVSELKKDQEKRKPASRLSQ